MIPFPRCKQCRDETDEEELKKGLCPKCRGFKKCDKCGEWVKNVNKKGVCENCIPRYIKLDSIKGIIARNDYGGMDGGELEKIKSSIDAIISTLDEIIICLPKETQEKILTVEVSFHDSNKQSFIKEEDKII